MTQIDAINRMLRYIGELPVPTTIVIDNLPEGHEARVAKTILSEISRELQEKGWWFNTEDWEFIPDSTGYITLPDSVIPITPSTTREKYMVKGGDLYDVTNKTKIFTTNITLKTVFEQQYSLSKEKMVLPLENEKISAKSIQSPHDTDAHYRNKDGNKVKGYSANITETCDQPAQDGKPVLNLITDTQVEVVSTQDNSYLVDP